MPTEIALPFALDASGAVSVETDPDKQIAQHVHGLVGTQPGERVMLRDYGVDTATLLFEPDPQFVRVQVQSEVQQALSRWEPGALLVGVNLLTDMTGDGMAAVEVDFVRSEGATTPRQLARNVNTAVLRVGGTVDEVITG
jgi:hypothetical protein